MSLLVVTIFCACFLLYSAFTDNGELALIAIIVWMVIFFAPKLIEVIQ